MPNMSDKSIQQFGSILHKEEYNSNENLKDIENIAPKKFYIVINGIVANFSNDKKANKEYIRAILFEKHIFLSVSDLNIVERISTDYFKCLTKTTFLVGNLDELLTLAQHNYELFLFIVKLNQVSIYYLQNRLDRLSLLDATDRYKIVKERIPNIDNLIPQYQIASYLNITPVQLSRIRKKMYSN